MVTATPNATATRKAIVIDDAPEIAQFLCTLCKATGYEATAYADARGAHIEDLRAAQMILLDLTMPGLDGVELMRRLGNQGLETPIILVSGHDASTLDSALYAGEQFGLNMRGTLQKPFSLAQFHEITHGLGEADEVPLERNGPDTAAIIAALQADAIEPHFQPKISLDRLELVGFEALARLRMPDGTLLGPDDFIGIATDHGLLEKLTDRMLVTALDAWRDWARRGFDWKVSVNIPASRLQDTDFPDQLEVFYRLWGIDRKHLILEITETELIEQTINSSDTLARLAMKQVALSVDDFGTGFSSLAQLKRLPCVEMKIDRSFIHDIETNDQSQAITRSCVDLGRQLGLTVTAEGIETQSQADLLREMGCTLGQGYFISRPESRGSIESTYMSGFAA